MKTKTEKLTKEDLFRNAGPERKYQPRADFSEFYFVCAVLATPLLSFIGTGTMLSIIIPFLAPIPAQLDLLRLFCTYGSFGALSGLVTHLLWACLTQANMPLVPKLSISMFGAISAALFVFGDIAEHAIKNSNAQEGWIIFVICIVPGLTGGLLALCTKTKKFNFMITPYR